MPKMPSSLYNHLICPVSYGKLRYDEQNQELISEKAGLAYPIRDNIPIMVASEARTITSKFTKSILS